MILQQLMPKACVGERLARVCLLAKHVLEAVDNLLDYRRLPTNLYIIHVFAGDRGDLPGARSA